MICKRIHLGHTMYICMESPLGRLHLIVRSAQESNHGRHGFFFSSREKIEKNTLFSDVDFRFFVTILGVFYKSINSFVQSMVSPSIQLQNKSVGIVPMTINACSELHTGSIVLCSSMRGPSLWPEFWKPVLRSCPICR